MIHRRFRADPHRALCRAVAALLDAEVTGLADEPWASITLEGRRHRLLATAIGAPERIGDLDDVEFEIAGHIVISVAVAERHSRATGEAITIEALTILDA